MNPVRVLWLVRDNLEQNSGGDTTQILQTKAGLERLGVAVDLASQCPVSFVSYDLIQLFHLDRLWEHLAVCRRMRSESIPAALSTIYWPADEFDRGGRAGFQGKLAHLLGGENYQTARLIQRCGIDCMRKLTLRGWDRRLCNFRKAARYLLESVAVILPNSTAEKESIERQFEVQRPAVVVPNAADVSAFALPEGTATPREGVLSVGRFEPRKNQLALLAALKGTDIPITFVGQAGRFNMRYHRKCRRLAGERVSFLDRRGPAELCRLYQAASVHACVSWYETPGLVSLEAGLSGCKLVVTPGGSTREYFGDDAFYCRPDDNASIRAAVERALAAEPPSRLAARVAREFNWDAAARETLRGYELALG